MYGSRTGGCVIWLAYAMCFITAILMVWIIIATFFTVSDCHQKGGEMVGTGEYTTHMISAGDGVFTTFETENTECSKK